MKYVLIVWYWLTAYVPRPLPTDHDEYLSFKQALHHYFGLDDNDHVWMTVASQIHSNPPTSLYRSYGKIANAAKRLKVNAIAQDQKLLALSNLETKLREKAEKLSKEAEVDGTTKLTDVLEGTFHSGGEVPSLPELKEGMV